MRILILDDNPERHDAFDTFLDGKGHEVMHAWTYWDAIGLLEDERFDLLYLDHDLNDHESASVISGMYGSRELTGLDVARFVARQLADDLKPERVVVHSWNPMGARSMVDILISVGISATYEPFANPTLKS
jgi:CheY-like chemotaxis protein